jgi:5-methyltetrahydropteroyltriglutamate--homocysteine methyltransferase
VNPPFRAEQIGSLLRPAELLRARADFAAGRIDRAALTQAEDDAIRHVVKLQEDAGMPVVTDGEFRRATYSDSFTSAGISGVEVQITDEQGFAASNTHGHRMARRIPKVVSKIVWREGQNARDFAFLTSVTKRTGKITLPGPAYIHYRAGRANISREAYPDLDAFWADLVAAYHAEMRALAAAGCTYLQIDETSLIKLGDPRVRTLLAERGDDWRDLLKRYIEAVNAVAAGVPQGMTVGIHICRSQDPNWQANTSYEPIAQALFNDMNLDLYYLEYEDARSGGFEPLRHAPPGKFVVLGMVSARHAAMESADALVRRIEDASKFIPLAQLGLSPHCGFATAADRTDMTEAVEAAKLARVAEVAKRVWG